MKKILPILASILFLGSLISCKSEITLSACKDGSVNVSFSGECGSYFEKMVRSFSGNDKTFLFDSLEIRQSFMNSGFREVSVSNPTISGLHVEMKDPGNSFLFSSGLLVCDKKDVFVTVSPSVLQKFYGSADPDILTFLDLLLAPVFNDEQMDVDEYLETVGSFYGEEATSEIGECKIKLNIISTEGKKKSFEVPLSKLLTLDETLVY